jgi:hypothetical protein
LEARRATGAVLFDEGGTGHGNGNGNGNGNDAVVFVVKPSGETESSDEEDHLKAMTYEHCLMEHLR